jgi:hypothetical protein
MPICPPRAARNRLARLLLACACASSCVDRSATLPEALLGEWRSDAPGYAGRYLSIERDGLLRLGLGQDGEQVARIEHVDELATSGAERRFVLAYVDNDGLDSTIELAWLAQRGQVIVGANRNVSWMRTEPQR